MNNRQRIFIAGGIIIITAIWSYKLGLFDNKINENMENAQNLAITENINEFTQENFLDDSIDNFLASEEKNIEANAKKSSTEKQQIYKEMVDLLGLGNPFSYSIPNAGDFSPFSGNKQIGSIIIKGIICLEKQDPIAVLQVSDNSNTYYVKKGSIIRVNNSNINSANSANETYIVVKDIRKDEVELIQQERPDKVIIVR